MFIVNEIFEAKYTKEKSTFLAYLLPIKDYHSHLIYLQKEHKKAAHFVRATRIYNEYSQIIEHSSDDGEPKGSSGVPVLNVMRGNELVDCGIIVVRYFGGKLLGVGGLVRAYTNASLNVIKHSTLLKFEQITTYTLELPLHKIEMAKYLSKKLEIDVIHFDFTQNFAIIHIETNATKIDKFISALNLQK
ncbi:hypothetical protein CCY99_04890 [Helicobacter sp. 16-1353]|uniref:YigZ family protein n=1 Tax=Helicobacter sp. 16-1353 TaxID=2004996 RepID=UPI000DCD236F|nr:YigZ family protein [Helicobacter sp. 16-1353]RAX54021.1 hypothetical protein CCY99_04890 [Helicobacter sp. 16-1353]